MGDFQCISSASLLCDTGVCVCVCVCVCVYNCNNGSCILLQVSQTSYKARAPVPPPLVGVVSDNEVDVKLKEKLQARVSNKH